MMLTSRFLLEACLVGFLEDNLYKITDALSAPYGTPPSERSVEQLLESSVVVINKQSGPSSHQVAAWLRDSFELKQTGHGGTLDPNVTGVLPISIGRASKVIKVMQESSKEYVCLITTLTCQHVYNNPNNNPDPTFDFQFAIQKLKAVI